MQFWYSAEHDSELWSKFIQSGGKRPEWSSGNVVLTDKGWAKYTVAFDDYQEQEQQMVGRRTGSSIYKKERPDAVLVWQGEGARVAERPYTESFEGQRYVAATSDAEALAAVKEEDAKNKTGDSPKEKVGHVKPQRFQYYYSETHEKYLRKKAREYLKDAQKKGLTLPHHDTNLCRRLVKVSITGDYGPFTGKFPDDHCRDNYLKEYPDAYYVTIGPAWVTKNEYFDGILSVAPIQKKDINFTKPYQLTAQQAQAARDRLIGRRMVEAQKEVDDNGDEIVEEKKPRRRFRLQAQEDD